MSTAFAANGMIVLFARLRLACEAQGVKPEDVRLEDLDDDARKRLLDAGTDDFWKYLEHQ